MTKAYSIRIYGRVFNVGFRRYVHRYGLQCNVVGYVENDRSSEEYENVLKNLYVNGGDALGDSYKRIFADYLVELYMAQRKYKDALTIKSEYGYV